MSASRYQKFYPAASGMSKNDVIKRVDYHLHCGLVAVVMLKEASFIQKMALIDNEMLQTFVDAHYAAVLHPGGGYQTDPKAIRVFELAAIEALIRKMDDKYVELRARQVEEAPI